MGHFSGHSPRKMPLRKVPRPWGRGLGWGGFHYLIIFLNDNGARATNRFDGAKKCPIMSVDSIVYLTPTGWHTYGNWLYF